MAGANAVSAWGADELTDEVLLERYTTRREEAAFAALVRRHSPMVLGVCRRVLHHEQDAEDAFQAVFCVLARKAGSIAKRAAVGAWLYAVACRIARKARARRGRQPVSQSDLPDIPAAEGSPEWAWKELRPILDAEVSSLPKKCRQAFILCYLEGLTNEQAAAQLGCPPGTVRSGLARARELLADRLTRRGLALSAGLLATALSQHAMAAVSAGQAETVVHVGLRYAAGQPVGEGVATLANGFLKTLLRARLAIILGLVSAVVVVVVVVCLLWYRPWGAGARNTPARAPTVAPTVEAEREKLQGTWQMVSMEQAGLRAQANQNPADMGFRFTGGQWAMLVQGNQGKWTPLMPFTLDPSQEPKAIDLTVVPGPNKQTFLGIYQVDGDSLTLCLSFVPAENGGKRPTVFHTRPSDPPGVNLFVLRREPAGPGGP
jgi:RNA polymerase sigma factor (sigma-70 family)